MSPERNSDKASRFERLAQRRVTEVLRKMRLIGNLANKRNYTYTEDHAKQIIDALESELRQVKARFRQETAANEQIFAFRK
jgi:hypothetical protein